MAMLFVDPTSPLRNKMIQSQSDSLAFRLNVRNADLGKANMDRIRNWMQQIVTKKARFSIFIGFWGKLALIN